MGAFIGYDEIGVWAKNRERDAFLDWYAAHRCQPHDARWEYCKSRAQRWSGCCLELKDLIPQGELLVLSDEERATAAAEFSPELAQLLGIISDITRGEWRHGISSEQAVHWRNVSLTLSHDEALVLYEFFARFAVSDGDFTLRSKAEYLAFMTIATQLTAAIGGPAPPRYSELLRAARDRLARGYEGPAPGVGAATDKIYG